MQYKVIIRRLSPLWEHPRKTALSQVVVHYEGPNMVYLPVTVRGP